MGGGLSVRSNCQSRGRQSQPKPAVASLTVHEGEGHRVLELRGGVAALAAEVDDHRVARVVGLEEVLHLAHGVAVALLRADRGEAHRDDLRRDVREVQVEAVLLEAALLLGDDAAQAVHREDRAEPRVGGAGAPLAQRLRQRGVERGDGGRGVPVVRDLRLDGVELGREPLRRRVLRPRLLLEPRRGLALRLRLGAARHGLRGRGHVLQRLPLRPREAVRIVLHPAGCGLLERSCSEEQRHVAPDQLAGGCPARSSAPTRSLPPNARLFVWCTCPKHRTRRALQPWQSLLCLAASGSQLQLHNRGCPGRSEVSARSTNCRTRGVTIVSPPIR